MDKKRIVKDYEKLPEDVVVRLKQQYPYGYADNLVSFLNKEGKKVSALPFETEDIYYLIRMTISEANQIIKDDDDYDSDGNLRDDFATDIPDDELGDESEDESGFDDDEATVRLKSKKGVRSDEDDYGDDDEPSESPDYL
jgi:hypothetical protein